VTRFDAGDHVKFGFPMAASVTNLAWGADTFAGGYEAAKQVKRVVQQLEWANDYFIAANPKPGYLIGQIGLGGEDHGYWGPAEILPTSRKSYAIDQSKHKCGSDLAGETAAAMAASAIFFNR